MIRRLDIAVVQAQFADSSEEEGAIRVSRTGQERPHVFIGSSTEGLSVANTLQVLLDYDAEVEIWNQGTFEPGGTTLESLVRSARTFDFAVLIVTPDDTIRSRGETRNITRDNVLFELGLFMGALGKERVYMLYDRVNRPDLPSDLAGVTPVTYALHKNGNLQASLGAASTRLKEVFQREGLREAQQTEVELSQPSPTTASRGMTGDEVEELLKQMDGEPKSESAITESEPETSKPQKASVSRIPKTEASARSTGRAKTPPFNFDFRAKGGQAKKRKTVVNVYSKGHSLLDIAHMAATPRDELRRILTEAGVELRPEDR